MRPDGTPSRPEANETETSARNMTRPALSVIPLTQRRVEVLRRHNELRKIEEQLMQTPKPVVPETCDVNGCLRLLDALDRMCLCWHIDVLCYRS